MDYSKFSYGCQTTGDPPGREEDGAPVGLSTSHKTLTGPRVDVWLDGSLMCVHSGRKRDPADVGGGLRGMATFSKNSRRRLLFTMCKMKRGNVPLFVTLTYPSVFPDPVNDRVVYKKHLEHFFERLERRFPGVAVLWRLQFQKRAAPHFHLFVWGVDYVRLLLCVSKMWYETVGSGDVKH